MSTELEPEEESTVKNHSSKNKAYYRTKSIMKWDWNIRINASFTDNQLIGN